MELKVGVIGTGAIGKEHITRLTNKLSGAKVVAVTDVNEGSAKEAAALCGARVEKSDKDVINASDVDAVIVTSWGPAHAASVLAAIEAGKPVFCEKPLATTAADCKKIVDAEIARGKKLVQVGYMRRYDKGYLQLKEILDSGKVGAPLMIHCTHRNPSVDASYITSMAVSDTAVHEIDVLHWLTGEQYKSAQVLFPKSTSLTHSKLKDPQIMILTTESGIVINLEVFVNCQFGYDIQCEVVCEKASIKMPDPLFPSIKMDAEYSTAIETSWKRRFIDAYDVELQDWINAAKAGGAAGPTAWDGYLVGLGSDALVKAQETGKVEPVNAGPCPSFYR
ncbi:MAG: Gfo/Idh/MocA family oxidoreductase [Treponema sp.]|jgi:myo-inositol 2-dehydrogenase/D-chiro-inositol 1-dehydrogenase|nr:Gfo/Idh/MocA family oxidoreductase [Treponema sp.]